MKSMEDMIQAAQAAAQTIQKQMNEVQARLDTVEVEGKAGGGLVRIRCTARGRILGVDIDDSLLVAEDKAMLEDLIVAAFNDARSRADQVSNAEMQQAQSGMGLPPGLSLPGLG
jgi:DNA-binding YbaB/EbfC family protein